MSLSEAEIFLVLCPKQECYCQSGLHYVSEDRSLLSVLRGKEYGKVIFLEGNKDTYTLTAYDEESFRVAAPGLKKGLGKPPTFTPEKGKDSRVLNLETARKIGNALLHDGSRTALVMELETLPYLCDAVLSESGSKNALVLRGGLDGSDWRKQLLGAGGLQRLWSSPTAENLFSVLRRNLGERFIDRSVPTEEELRNMVAAAELETGHILGEGSRRDVAALLYYSYCAEDLADKNGLILRCETPRKALRERLEQERFLVRLREAAARALEGEAEGRLSEKLRREYPNATGRERREENRITRFIDEELRLSVPEEKQGELKALRDFYATPWNRTLSEEAEGHLADALGYLVMMYEHGQQRNADRLLTVLRDNVCTAAILEKAENVSNAVSLYAQTGYQLASYEESEKKLEETVAEKREKKEQCHQYIREMGENGNIVRRWKMYLDAERVAEAQLERLRAEQQVLYDTRETLEQGLTEYRLSHRSFSEQQLERFKADMERIARQQTAQELPNLAESVSTQTAPADMSGVWDAYYEEHPEEQRQNIRRMKRLL